MKNVHLEYWQGRVDSKLELIAEAQKEINNALEYLRKNKFDKAQSKMEFANSILDEAWD